MAILIVMAMCAALCVVGVILLVLSRGDMVGRPQKLRHLNVGRFPRMPVDATPLAPIPDRSTRWQIGLGLVIYPGIGLAVSTFIWLDSRH